MKKYRVIWFDDEHQIRKKIRERAHLNNIELIGFDNAKEGITVLRNNIKTFDAALLDGIFYLNPNEKGTPTEDDAMGEVAKELLRLEGVKKLPWFILSGQDSFTKEKNHYAKTFKSGEVFDKLGADEDYNLLWQKIKDEADKNLDTQIRHKYTNIVGLCEDGYLGSKHQDRIFKILQDIEEPQSIRNSQDLLTPIRKIIEALFSKLNEIGFIPDEICNSPGWINGSSFFLSGRNNEYEYNTELIHPAIAENIHRLLTVTQDASHNEGSRLGVDSYLSSNNNTFLYRSTLFLLLDILEWTKGFIDNNPNRNENLTYWELKPIYGDKVIYEGTIEQDESGNFYCGQYLMNKNYVERNNHLGKRILVKQFSDNGIFNLKNNYPYFASQYEIKL